MIAPPARRARRAAVNSRQKLHSCFGSVMAELGDMVRDLHERNARGAAGQPAEKVSGAHTSPGARRYFSARQL